MKTQLAAEAVEGLIKAYGRLVFHLIYGMIHDWHESEDLTQEVFLSAFRGIDAAQTACGAQFQAKAWLLHITVNTVRMYWRRQRLIHFVPFSHLETAQAGTDVISELAAPVQPGGYCTVEGGGDPETLLSERDACSVAPRGRGRVVLGGDRRYPGPGGGGHPPAALASQAAVPASLRC